MKKILIVDDQAEIRELLQVTLQIGGFKNLFLAADGKEAVKIAMKEKPDLILMDVMMPGKINGIKATSILKMDQRSKNSTIVMLSAKAQKQDIEKGLDAGADDYWVKPFSPLKLLNKVKVLLWVCPVKKIEKKKNEYIKHIQKREEVPCRIMP